MSSSGPDKWLYTRCNGNNIELVILIYVDEIIIKASNNDALRKAKQVLSKEDKIFGS